MINLRTAISAAVVTLAALAANPASADLYLYVDGSLVNTPPGNNGFTQFQCLSGCADGYTTITMSMFGQLGPSLVQDANTDLDASASATQLTLKFVETNLTASGVEGFLSQFTGNLTGNISSLRTFYVDASNGQSTGDAGITQVGQISTVCTSSCVSNGGMSSFANTVGGSGKYSLIETMVVTPTGASQLGVTDTLFSVPEPVSLSLFGTGLVAFGAMTRRRKNKKAA